MSKYWGRAAHAGGYCARTFVRGLAAMVALPVLLYSAVLCLLGIGLLVLPAELRVLRRFADSERARVGRWVEATAPVGPHAGRPLFAMLAELATIRDLRWVPGMMVAGTVLGLFGALMVLLPLVALGVIGLWWLFPADDPIRVLASVPIDSWPTAFAVGIPQLLLTVLLALFVPPAVAKAAAAVSRWLLAPSVTAELAERVSTLDKTRAGAIAAHGSELRRIERDLHDGTQARLVSIAMQLGLAERKLANDPQAVGPLLAKARAGAEDAMVELRDVLRSVYPPVLADRGLEGALTSVVARCPVPSTVDCGELGEVPPQVEAAVYFTVTEALTNVAKHSGAGSAVVRLERIGTVLRAEVSDDGHGGAAEGGGDNGGTGLRGVRQRVESVDGTLRVDSPHGGPTMITVECPCGS
ncbi:signal transduction histidine kinase [Herbihabitans rhizosphaerae]|uniref:histidine kinase n=1 Tax=Herbihabitans rhizosphaerae TaxID=1872711 RepID=A0A4Q7L640_9PSEU|nr:sensor histidine kinase [Herbihabitans rhizosphaerae]RZS44764.1 signal transduction histidine kinase [Herbihabitans rhizosphaerae]